MRNQKRLILTASVAFCILLSGLALAQNQATGKSEGVSKLVIGTTDQVEDINVNDGIFNTYREAFLTKSLIRVDQAGNFVPSLAESWETKDAKNGHFTWSRTPPGMTARL